MEEILCDLAKTKEKKRSNNPQQLLNRAGDMAADREEETVVWD